jgi:arginyl-tRNA synthetase
MLEEEIKKLLKPFTEEVTLETPSNPEFGDLALPCFDLAKKQKRNPQEIAKEIAEKIELWKTKMIKKVEVKGGYVNFFLNWENLTDGILKNIIKESRLNLGKGKRVMVEYSQPNPIHPMHIGHARSTFLGDTMANIFEILGYKVVHANYMNDTGLQVAKLVTSYKLWANNKRPEGKPDFWLWQYYVKFHEEATKDTTLDEKAQETLRKFEIEKDKKTVKLWNEIVRWCVKGFEQTYKRVGVSFDVYFYENKFRKPGKKIVEEIIKKGIAFKTPEEATVADLDKYGLGGCVILRSDGTGLYYTSDLALTVHKFKKYKLNKAVWSVSSEQNLYFKQLFKLLELLGYPWAKDCYHLSFELVRLPEGKMSSREGRAVLLDEVVEKLSELAYEEVKKRNSELPEKVKKEIAEKIAIGALKYAIVKIEPDKTITFDWQQMLRFEGDTGPYLQYAHTRCNSILNKISKWRIQTKIEKLTEEEKNLIKVLNNFSGVLEHATKDLRPHYICNYVYDLATTFSNFYQACPVLKAENNKLRNFRLTLVKATAIILKNSLNLLGIEVPEKM